MHPAHIPNWAGGKSLLEGAALHNASFGSSEKKQKLVVFLSFSERTRVLYLETVEISVEVLPGRDA